MFKRLLYILILLFINIKMLSQVNIVPNPSFEIFTICPTWYSQTNYAYPWFAPSAGTSDYFNSCSSGVVDVPLNAFGYQSARTGFAYAGGEMTNGFREYISSPLNNPMIKGKDYCIEFYVSLCETSYFMHSDTVSLGMYISVDSIYNVSTGILPYTPQISNDPFLVNVNDTLNWVKISGIYNALGGEKFITIGNFYPDEFFFGANYYYVDDVSIVECDNGIFIPNIFTPNNDGINDFFEIKNLPENSLIQIFNRWGLKMFETTKSNIFWDGRATGGNEVADGTYFYIVNTNEETYKGFVQLIH